MFHFLIYKYRTFMSRTILDYQQKRNKKKLAPWSLHLKTRLIDACLFIPDYKAGLSRQDSGKAPAELLWRRPYASCFQITLRRPSR